MTRRAVFTLVTLLAVALGSVLGAAAFNLRRAGPAKVAEGPEDESSAPAPSAPTTPALAAAAPTTAARGAAHRQAQGLARLDARVEPTAAPTEAALMERLRGLEGSDPPLTYQLAREGNARFPDGPDAAERSWMIAKSLVDMHRLHEAFQEAQGMVSRYPGTSWAQDLQRHLLSNPLD